MVRRDVAEWKIARAGSWLDDAEEIPSRATEELSNDLKSRDLACFYLLLAIQESVDLAAHAVADAGWSPPEDAGGVFDVLADHDVIDRTSPTPCTLPSASGTVSPTATCRSTMLASIRKRRPVFKRSEYLGALAAFAGV